MPPITAFKILIRFARNSGLAVAIHDLSEAITRFRARATTSSNPVICRRLPPASNNLRLDGPAPEFVTVNSLFGSPLDQVALPCQSSRMDAMPISRQISKKIGLASNALNRPISRSVSHFRIVVPICRLWPCHCSFNVCPWLGKWG